MRISDWSSDVCSSDLTQLGLLYLSDDDDGFLSRIDIIAAVAEQLSMALSNLSLRESLRLQSIRDPLTGLFNRRYLAESATRELEPRDRRGPPPDTEKRRGGHGGCSTCRARGAP